MKSGHFRSRGQTTTIKIFLILIMFAALPLRAEELKPVYSSAEPERKWQKMHASSFVGTVSDLVRQCRAQSIIDMNDSLTMEKCLSLEALAIFDKGVVVSVPDGVVFTFMQGRVAGKSVTLKNIEKKLGREDKALWFYLGDGVHAYWFTGEKGVSCNNLAIVLPLKPKPEPKLEPKPAVYIPPLEKKPFSDVVGRPTISVVPSVQLQGCCCDDPKIINGSVYIDEGPKIKSKGYSQTGD